MSGTCGRQEVHPNLYRYALMKMEECRQVQKKRLVEGFNFQALMVCEVRVYAGREAKRVRF